MATPLVPTSGGSIYFYRETEHPYGFLSQWYALPFTVPNPSDSESIHPKTFLTTEQYMMYHKALIFKDCEVADKIMRADQPKTQKLLGRQVRGFKNKVWNEVKEKIVEEGNWWKFTGSRENLRSLLLDTGNRELVEASPVDRIWGVGFDASKAEANRADWGENLLGKALMKVRDRLRLEEELV